jgi:hypothetical protein
VRSVDDHMATGTKVAGILARGKGYELQPVTELDGADLFAGAARERLLAEFTGWPGLPRTAGSTPASCTTRWRHRRRPA